MRQNTGYLRNSVSPKGLFDILDTKKKLIKWRQDIHKSTYYYTEDNMRMLLASLSHVSEKLDLTLFLAVKLLK